MVHFETLTNGLLAVVAALDQGRVLAGVAVAVALGRAELEVVDGAAVGAGPPRREAIYDLAVRDLDIDRYVQLVASPFEQPSSAATASTNCPLFISCPPSLIIR